MKPISKKSKNLVYAVTAVYGLTLVYLLFLYRMGRDYPFTYFEYLLHNINFIPLMSVYNLVTTPVISKSIILEFAVNFIGNILLFVPWGFLMPLCFKKLEKFKPFILVTIVSIILIEAVQLFAMLGSFDIEDILLNTLGAVLGYLCYKKLFA